MKDLSTWLLAALTGVFFTLGVSTASAAPIINPEVHLNVTCTAGQIEDGPLSFGLTALPSEVNANFLLGPGTPGTAVVAYGLGNVSSAEVSFGDATRTGLANFSMVVMAGNVTSLTYAFSTINTATTTVPVILNFPLTITGTDKDTGAAFEYQYGESVQSITAVPEPTTLIDGPRPSRYRLQTASHA